MLTWFAFSLALSAAIVFVMHRLYRFLIQALTCPIEKDIAVSAFDEYKNMYRDIHRGIVTGSNNGIDIHRGGVVPDVSSDSNVVIPNVSPEESVFAPNDADGLGSTPFDADMDPYVRNMSHTYNNVVAGGALAASEKSCDAVGHKPSRGMVNELNDFIQTNRRLDSVDRTRAPESFRF